MNCCSECEQERYENNVCQDCYDALEEKYKKALKLLEHADTHLSIAATKDIEEFGFEGGQKQLWTSILLPIKEFLENETAR